MDPCWFIVISAFIFSIIDTLATGRNWLLEHVVTSFKHSRLRILAQLRHGTDKISLLLEKLTQPVHVLIHEVTSASVWPHHHGFLANEIPTRLWLLHLQHALCLEIFTLHSTHGARTYLHSVTLGDLVHILGLGHSSHTLSYTRAKPLLVLHEHRHWHVTVELALVLEIIVKTLSKLPPCSQISLNQRIHQSQGITLVHATERLGDCREGVQSANFSHCGKVSRVMISKHTSNLGLVVILLFYNLWSDEHSPFGNQLLRDLAHLLCLFDWVWL